jgi:hypothetical protein
MPSDGSPAWIVFKLESGSRLVPRPPVVSSAYIRRLLREDDEPIVLDAERADVASVAS